MFENFFLRLRLQNSKAFPKLKVTILEFTTKSILRKIPFDKKVNAFLAALLCFFRAKITDSLCIIFFCSYIFCAV